MQGQKGATLAGALVVDRASKLTFAGAALAGNEHGRSGAGDLTCDAINLLQGGARADEAIETLALALAKLAAELCGL
jgi:hypothetical protein